MEDSAEKEEQEKTEKKFESLTTRIKTQLEKDVKEVRVTHRLTDSPACLVVDDEDMGEQMRRIMEAAGQTLPETKPIFELNPEHPLIVKLDKEQDEERFADLVSVIFDQASLAEGRQLEDPGQFTRRLNKLLLEMCD
jgi:molecular chaperone HtpG